MPEPAADLGSIVRGSLGRLSGEADALVAHFYAALFTAAPALREMFPVAMDHQRDRLFKALCDAAGLLDDPARLDRYLSQLGRDHRKYGVVPEHYAPVGEALMATLRAHAGEAWTAPEAEAWAAVYNHMASVMIAAAEEDAAAHPPVWSAVVVDHQLRTPDVAVLTVRPDQYYPYRAGQYATVETGRWPRVWRPYSIANAPRPDGLLTLHVRAVPAGWVSSALVRHTGVGDVIRLGPARGSMVVAGELTRRVLCVGGGTGLAPVKALAEEMVTVNRPPSLHLFFGARTREELYDWADLERMASFYPRLLAVPVVSDDPGWSGVRGTLSEVLPAQGRWTDHEAFVSGPDPMVRSVVAWLRSEGVPEERLHFDLFGPDGERAPARVPAGV
ncbi:hypothetical protein BIV57_19400 [Mangrovactinospora gilvigrisea]|uniref:nitric oxide dioxygenase n=1 Tax=Mangrovactinospora gilvigrisea TaxID=1428644 RepID=A0A1J7C8B3_9ACTN|nr:globin domain-containing protein [Mangrovactinospora gilvigrisea]OIV35882.1 hypothetical protein BIV57_19400 [Mangrovactinospora gilvigrisea]